MILCLQGQRSWWASFTACFPPHLTALYCSTLHCTSLHTAPISVTLPGLPCLPARLQFVNAVMARWPNAVLQFEDFQMAHALTLLQRYRDHHLVFNDDIQVGVVFGEMHGDNSMLLALYLGQGKSAGTTTWSSTAPYRCVLFLGGVPLVTMRCASFRDSS